ncbi:MAG: DedA family protein [Clostridia bacterium]|nr:DedA family protein [Clostridia bacterium]MCI2014086.1 DedA family protein [Clostridia bacterium]
MADLILILMSFVNKFGYFGVFFSTTLEYACFPVSSEILLPFIGCCVYNGTMSLSKCIGVSLLGAVLGCSACFFAGRFGRRVIDKLSGKSIGIKNGIKKSESKFKKYGSFSVFIFRLFPISRTYISFPAGMSSMSYTTFIVYSVLGALVWNTVLISIGYMLGEHWEDFTIFFEDHKNLVNLIFILICLMIVFKILKNRKSA